MSPDTIYALSSGKIPSGIAILRLSGPHVRSALDQICRKVPPPRVMKPTAFFGRSGEAIDHGLVVLFPGPASFTGEDVAEFHCHGGVAVVAALLQRVGEVSGCRLAEPGEFSRRAFINGKFDLTSAEALADLIAAETETQRKLAISNAAGGQQKLYGSWRQRIIHARAMIEAEVDFVDEDDVSDGISSSVWEDMGYLAAEIDLHIAAFHRAEMIREGFKIVVAGAPNAGKSSLVNALARRDVAIVTDEPGTTRDAIDVSLDIDGNKVFVTDTAGIRNFAGKVENIGIERARERISGADLVLCLEDIRRPSPVVLQTSAPVWRIGSKADTADGSSARNNGSYKYLISSLTGFGIPEMLSAISREVTDQVGTNLGSLPSRLRHIEHLRSCVHALQCALTDDRREVELRAEELRLASTALARISGQVDADDILDVIFSQFCIGK